MHHDGIPERLRNALRDHPPSGPITPVAQVAGRGHIAVAAAHGVRRMVLVGRTFYEDGRRAALAWLLTNEVEMATDVDYVLDRSNTGLPFLLSLQTDLYVSVWTDQLTAPIGYVTDDVLAAVPWGLPEYDGTEHPALRRGLPLRGPMDPRWEFKRREAVDLRVLGADRLAWALGDG